jgi:hypothetical protein
MARQSKCYLCGTDLEKIAVGLNKKLLGSKVTRFFCLSCLSDYLDATVEELSEKAEEFKKQGCVLFG